MTAEPPISVTLENRLMSSGYYVERYERATHDGETVVTLEYEAVSPVPVVTSDEVGEVVRTIVAVAREREEWTPPTFEVSSYTTAGELRGRWRVDSDWFERLGEDLTEVGFSTRVLHTVTIPSPEN